MKTTRGFKKTYRFEIRPSDKILVFVDAQRNEKERERFNV